MFSSVLGMNTRKIPFLELRINFVWLPPGGCTHARQPNACIAEKQSFLPVVTHSWAMWVDLERPWNCQCPTRSETQMTRTWWDAVFAALVDWHSHKSLCHPALSVITLLLLLSSLESLSSSQLLPLSTTLQSCISNLSACLSALLGQGNWTCSRQMLAGQQTCKLLSKNWHAIGIVVFMFSHVVKQITHVFEGRDETERNTWCS